MSDDPPLALCSSGLGPHRRGARSHGLRLTASLLALVALLAVATACRSGTVRGIVKIGLVGPFGGSDTATGLQMLFAARLALREWNAEGGVNGFRVALQAEDDHDAAPQGEQQARAMVIDPAVVGVVGHITAESAEAGARHYGEAGLALVTFGNVADWSQIAGSETVFRLTSAPQQLARTTRDLVLGTLKAKNVVIVHEPGTANAVFVQSISQELHSAGASAVRRVVVAVTQSRYDEAAQGIADIQPAAVIIATNFVTAGEIAAKLRPLTPAPIVLAPQAERLLGHVEQAVECPKWIDHLES